MTTDWTSLPEDGTVVLTPMLQSIVDEMLAIGGREVEVISEGCIVVHAKTDGD